MFLLKGPPPASLFPDNLIVPAIALDIPSPYAEQIRQLRLGYSSWRAAIPPEITIAGSSGVGELVYSRGEEELVAAELQRVARATAPVRVRFRSAERFPGMGILYLSLEPEAPFHRLQAELVASDFRFLGNPFPFTPHCTVCDLAVVPDATKFDLSRICFSRDTFIIETMSLYHLDRRILRGDPRGCTLLYRTRLTGADPEG